MTSFLYVPFFFTLFKKGGGEAGKRLGEMGDGAMIRKHPVQAHLRGKANKLNLLLLYILTFIFKYLPTCNIKAKQNTFIIYL